MELFGFLAPVIAIFKAPDGPLTPRELGKHDYGKFWKRNPFAKGTVAHQEYEDGQDSAWQAAQW